ncbi:beige/beach-related [Anaeramoeba ignava]|uniref:Beige/beach-related n=1 Tax=Anaeramoeba ignava TaxID=1746090 RepID=A0A9Q0REY3_ANAIG|nr:beige/beach-related [Anaeramoeba ignava]
MKCEIISKIQTRKGIFGFRENLIYFFEEFDSQKEKEKEKKEYKWKIKNIQSIYKRRFNFKYSGLEIFFEKERKFIFFNFETMEKRDEIYEYLQNHKLRNINKSNYYPGNKPIKWNEKQMTRKWQERKITNFEYLMYLNTISGRTYQDISQYPIFPWIISDYESKKINLNNPKTFRDLSKPMGYLNNKIIIHFEKYQKNEKEKEFQFNYLKMYSNPEIVSSYLIRLEPFTSICLKEKYPIFKSIPKTWKAIQENDGDYFIAELTPEFFHLPDFLRKQKIFKHKHENLNEKTILQEISNVELPKWAKTAEDFIQIQQEALESEYVSEHLNEWIDLIFGYKQKGEEAKKAYNLFHPNLYEENINILKTESIQKEIQRKGQIPIQLFTQKHIKKLTKEQIEQKYLFKPRFPFHLFEWKNILSNKNFIINIKKFKISSKSVIFINYYGNKDLINKENSSVLLTIDKDGEIRIQKIRLNNPNANKNVTNFTFWIDTKIEEKKGKIWIPFQQDLNNFQGYLSLDQNWKYLICSGFNDNSFKIIDTENYKMIQSISKHKDIVNCLSTDWKYLVTGSKDTTVIVWKIYSKEKKKVKSVAISVEYDIVLSGSINGELIFHSLNKGKHIQTIILSDQEPISIIKITKEGNIITFSQNSNILRLFTINGYLVKEVICLQNIYSISITPDSKFLFLGGEKGIFEIRNMFDLKGIKNFDLEEKIYSILIIEKTFLVVIGLSNGELIIGNFIENSFTKN